MSDIDGRHTYLLNILQGRGALPGGAVGVAFDHSQDGLLSDLLLADMIELSSCGPRRFPSWRLTEAGVQHLDDVVHEMEALIERMAQDA